MPKSISGTSKEGDDASSSDPSVFDFLYYDSRRIGSYLSQFDPDGHLQQVTSGKSGTKGKKNTSTHEGKGGIPGFAEGAYTKGIDTSVDMTQGYERVFDPLWTNARTFLDHLSENDLIQHDIGLAQPGQFVLVTGHLDILDLMLMKQAWKMPAIQRALKQGIVQGAAKNSTAAQKAAEKEQKANADQLVELLQIMPHSINATLITPAPQVPHMLWCALNEEYMATPATEIVMAHGGFIPGLWSILGVLNARPDFVAVNNMGKESINADLDPGIMDSMVGRVSKMLAPIVRVAAGRPANANAVTPLLIFREVEGPSLEGDIDG